jgi:beta-barrel assembly-enhancing protease
MLSSAVALCAGFSLLFTAAVPAETPAANAPPSQPVSAAAAALTADIAAQPLAQALESFSRQTEVQYVAVAGLVNNQQTRGVPAGLTANEALAGLLEGTGLRSESLNERTVRIVAVNPMPGTDVPLPPLEEVVIRARRILKPYVSPASASEQQALAAANADLEALIARKHLLYGNASLDRYMQTVAERLLAVDQTDPGSVQVRVIKLADANAFALSNGSIYLTTALLVTLDDEAQLAAVLGHELTHYTNYHALLGLRQENHEEILARIEGALIDSVMAVVSAHYGAVYNGQPVFTLEDMEIWARASITGYSRKLEREADDGGIRRMIAAGYDPSGALAALEHLAGQSAPAASAAQIPLYASHPRIAQRLASYRDLLAGELARAAGVGERRPEEYRAQLGQLPLDAVALLIEENKLDRAEQLLAAEIARTDTGRAEFLKGEIWRKRVPQTDATVRGALAAYERAVTLTDAPLSAYRQAGILHRKRGESEAAALAFQSYLEHAPNAVDAPLVRIFLDELRSSSPVPEVRR